MRMARVFRDISVSTLPNGLILIRSKPFVFAMQMRQSLNYRLKPYGLTCGRRDDGKAVGSPKAAVYPGILLGPFLTCESYFEAIVRYSILESRLVRYVGKYSKLSNSTFYLIEIFAFAGKSVSEVEG